MSDRAVSVGEGRTLLARVSGPERAPAVFALHGSPGSRLLHAPLERDAAKVGLRTISYDRPGYGGSTPAPGRTIGDTALEVRAIADAMGVDRFGVWGFSGGGAPALACAALLPDRVVGAVDLAGVAPYPAEGLDWEAGAGEANAEDFRLMVSDRAAWDAKARRERNDMLGWDARQLREGFASLCAPVDREVLTDEVAAYMLAQMKEGLRPGYEGIRDDNLSVVLPWGFAPEDVRVPVQLWHGGQDRFVPFAHGAWVAAHVPGVEAHLEPGEGHLSTFLRRLPAAHRWLKDRF